MSPAMRQMMSSDLDAVLGIEQAVQAYPWTRGNFADALASGYLCYVDEAAGELRGYAILMPAADEAEVLTIAVAAAQQRRGLGRSMLTQMLELARDRGLRRVFLEVRAANSAAIALYRSAGFVEVGARRGYYRDASGSEDAIVMACVLTGEENG